MLLPLLASALMPLCLPAQICCLPALRSAILAHYLLNERLHVLGWMGCLLCVVGSTTIVLHAPEERPIQSVAQIWALATEPGKAPHGACTPSPEQWALVLTF